MSLTPLIYRSTDPGAPLLSGTAGAMATLLDAVLVDGYGTGQNRKEGLGWSRAFSAVNLRAYRNAPVSGTGFYLRVDDTAAAAAWLRAYSSMSDINTGLDGAPSEQLKPNGSPWEKSTQANATERHWMIVGNERFFYLFVDTGGQFSSQAYTGTHGHYAGDALTLKPGDRHNYVVSYKGSDSIGSSGIGFAFRARGGWGDNPNADSTTALFMGRSHTGSPGSIRAGITAAGLGTPVIIGGNASHPAYPYPGSGGLLFSPVEVFEAPYQPRGFLPGCYAPLHKRPFPDQTVISNVEGFPAGARLLAKNVTSDTTGGFNDTYTGQILLDITGPWG